MRKIRLILVLYIVLLAAPAFAQTYSGIIFNGFVYRTGTMPCASCPITITMEGTAGSAVTSAGGAFSIVITRALTPGTYNADISINDGTTTRTLSKRINVAAGGAPTITGITTNLAQYPGSQVPRYEKLEITFNAATNAQNPQLPYDTSPPAGIVPGIGATINGVFSQDNFITNYTIPAFYYQNFLDETRNNMPWYYPTGTYSWKIRFAPNQQGNWQFKITARDSQGYAESAPTSFTVAPSTSKGFVKVSGDTRYFEFENGTYFPALSINSGLAADNPTATQTLFQALGQNKIQLIRFWLSSWSIFGSSWNPWYEMRNTYDGYIPRTGLATYGSGGQQSMKLRLTYSDSGTQWYDSCRLIGAYGNLQAIKPNTNYQIRVNYSGSNIAGPRNAIFPNYGLVVKSGSWFGSSCDDGGSGTAITPYGGNTNGWQYLQGTWNSGSSNFIGINNYIFLVLENVLQGATGAAGVYVDSIEMREDIGGGQYGPNIFTKSSPEHHTYFQQRNSYAFDKILDQAKQNDVYLKTVIMEKDDYALLLLNRTGGFGNSDPNNFYGEFRTMTAGRWLQQAWWRYLQARWGYSTQIQSWELVNEGDPSNSRHYALADELGKYMHQFTPNKHLVTTSFWTSFPTAFWASSSYPDVDFADVHRYIAQADSVFNDSALATDQISMQYGALQPGGANKPVFRGETGFVDAGSGPASTQLSGDTQGVWLKNFLWAGLNPGGLIESYWYVNEHIYNPQQGFDHRPSYRAYYNFVSEIPLSSGNYQNISAAVSDPRILVYGQKNTATQKAHLWIRNSVYTWRNVVSGGAITPVSGTATISGFTPNGQYRVDWWSTSQPDRALQVTSTQSVMANGAGQIVLTVDSLAADTAAKISGTAPGNAPPTVSISSPASGATFTAPASVAISATASDSDGSVARVEFYNGAALLSNDTAPPYSFTWTNVAQGSYSLTARAIDNMGAPTTSTAVSIMVSSGVALPTASLSASPSSIVAGQSSTLSWTTSGATTVSINQGIGTVASSGSTTVSPTITTTYTITATNAAGSVTSSATVTVSQPGSGSTGEWYMAGANPQRSSRSTADVTTVSGVAWYRPIEAYISGSTQIITSGGRIYVATAKGLIVLDAENGNLVCRFDTELPVNTPTVDGGVVYLSGFDHKLYALNAASCATIWTFTGASAGYSANPLVTGGRVYIGNRDGRFYSINTANGALAWSYTTGGPVMQSAAYDNGVVYFASMDMYGYALNTASGSLVWRTPQKLPGERYSHWWPVIFGNYVVWTTNPAYRLHGDPGVSNTPLAGEDFGVFFPEPMNSTTAGTVIASSDGSHGWPVGSRVMSTTTGTAPYTLQGWVDTLPYRRLYAIVSKSNGVEPFYLPLLNSGENGDGQLHPPASDGASLFVNTLYQDSGIARSSIFAWKEGTTWLRQLGMNNYAADEPLILSMANDRVYANLCCDRIAQLVDGGGQTFWNYGVNTMLDDILPSEGEPNSYDSMWQCYDGEVFLERLGCYYKGNINSRNGVYNHHGYQNPLVPHSFNNGLGQRVERLFTHRSNAIIALGPTASKTPLPLITINSNPPNAAAALSSAEVTQRLETEVQKMVDLYLAQGTNGFLRPAYMEDGGRISNANAMPEQLNYYSRPFETVYALSIAYPHLSPGLRANVLSYLSAYWQRYFATGTPVRAIGFSSGAARENLALPPEIAAIMAQRNDVISGQMPQRVFYAAWKYAQLVPSQAASIYSTVRPLLIYPPPSGAQFDIVQHPALYNDYIIGYQGFLNLYDLAGTNPDPALRANVAAQLASLLNTRLTNFAKDHPWQGDLDNPTSTIVINNYVRKFNCDRNFLYMTPDLGAAMRNSAQSSTINAALNEYLYVCPHWFMTRDHNAFQEASTHHMFDVHSLFLAKAYVAGESQASLSKWIDVSWMLGDLYHIQNLVATLEAP